MMRVRFIGLTFWDVGCCPGFEIYFDALTLTDV
jgi:hypothetical protein